MKTSMVRIQALFAAVLMLSVAACQTPQTTTSDSANTGSPVLSRDVGEYRLGAADELKITVYGEDDLSDNYVVNGEGFVSLPLIGEVKAGGKTIREFQKEAERLLAAGYLRNPSVTAEVLNFRPYYILGEVGRPGEYPFTNRLTVLNAIATAEGFTYRANKKIVMLKGVDNAEEIRVDLTPTTRVMPGDTIRVLERLF